MDLEQDKDSDREQDKDRDLEQDEDTDLEQDEDRDLEQDENKDEDRDLEQDEDTDLEQDKDRDLEQDLDRDLEQDLDTAADRGLEKDLDRDLDRAADQGLEKDLEKDLEYMRHAIDEARIGRAEGGIPIGAALVVDDEVVSTGRNRRVQMGSAIRHGETDCLENAGRLSAATYHRATLYTTLSPCQLCAGAALLYGIPRVVIGENRTFEASEEHLRANGVALTVLGLEECVMMMREFIDEFPALWNEDIGVEDPRPAPPHS